MAAGILVDTNVLVYAHDPADPGKQVRAIAVLAGLADHRAGILAAQSLAEFYWATTRTRRSLLTPAEAEAQIDRLAASWPVLDLTPAIVCEAVRGVRRHRLAYWDAQIWAAAPSQPGPTRALRGLHRRRAPRRRPIRRPVPSGLCHRDRPHRPDVDREGARPAATPTGRR